MDVADYYYEAVDQDGAVHRSDITAINKNRNDYIFRIAPIAVEKPTAIVAGRLLKRDGTVISEIAVPHPRRLGAGCSYLADWTLSCCDYTTTDLEFETFIEISIENTRHKKRMKEILGDRLHHVSSCVH